MGCRPSGLTHIQQVRGIKLLVRYEASVHVAAIDVRLRRLADTTS
jgi:hypothetical protein